MLEIRPATAAEFPAVAGMCEAAYAPFPSGPGSSERRAPVAGVELPAFVTPLGAPVSDRRARNGV